MADITRITRMSETDVPAAHAMVDMARMFLAAQARGEIPRVALSQDGRITLRWASGDFVSYQTGVDTSSVPVSKG